MGIVLGALCFMDVVQVTLWQVMGPLIGLLGGHFLFGWFAHLCVDEMQNVGPKSFEE